MIGPFIISALIGARPHGSTVHLRIRRERALYFRAHLSAAPLKLLYPKLPPGVDAGFPRSSERGPIEASRHSYLRLLRSRISALIGARPHGSQGSKVSLDNGSQEFPRSSERGPIEAVRRNSVFHARTGISALIGARPHGSGACGGGGVKAPFISALIGARPHGSDDLGDFFFMAATISALIGARPHGSGFPK